MIRVLLSVLGVGLLGTGSLWAQTREEKVRNDKAKVEAAGVWIYNNFPKAVEEAKSSRKPIMAVLRCLPCEECVKLDDEIIDADSRIQPLLEKFVRVRLVSTNGLDLSLFQFDTDQSFAVFFLNADGTIYGRFGTRSDRKNWVGDVSVDGLAKAMRGALVLHNDFPENRQALQGKRGPAPQFARPELFPSLKSKYTSTLNYEGKVVPSCIHCHQIGDAARDLYFNSKNPIPEEVLFPYPHPKTIGLTLDPKEMASVLGVEKASAAAKAGFRPGDQITTLQGQPLLSIADVQWVLHRVPATGGEIVAEVKRGQATETLKLQLSPDWRRRGDLAWRASTWELRRKAIGGIFSKELPEANRKDLQIPEGSMALLVEHVGLYAPHDVAHRAGVKKGDIIIGVDGRTDLPRETDLIAWSLQNKKEGSKVVLEILRDGKKQMIAMRIPD